MKAVRINQYALPVLAVVALLGSTWIAKAAGVWQTSGRGQILLDESGQADPMGIKGWMTLADVSETYQVPLDTLYLMLGAGPDLPSNTELKELEGRLPGTGVSSVRAAVAAYLEGSWVPANGPYGREELEDSAPTAPTASPHAPEGSGGALGLPTDGGRLPASQIKGRMTLGEVVDACQVPLDYLVAELDLPADVDTRLLVRELPGSYGIEVRAVRDAVQRYQESH